MKHTTNDNNLRFEGTPRLTKATQVWKQTRIRVCIYIYLYIYTTYHLVQLQMYSIFKNNWPFSNIHLLGFGIYTSTHWVYWSDTQNLYIANILPIWYWCNVNKLVCLKYNEGWAQTCKSESSHRKEARKFKLQVYLDIQYGLNRYDDAANKDSMLFMDRLTELVWLFMRFCSQCSNCISYNGIWISLSLYIYISFWYAFSWWLSL